MEAFRNVALITLIVLGGCAHDPSPLARPGLMDLGSRILRHGCPANAGVVEREVVNHYDPNVTDSIKTITCDGVVMEIYVGVLASDPRGLPMRLEIRKPNAQLPQYMNIDESVRCLVAVLGQPAEQNDRTITYNPDESDDSVTFSVQEGRITAVRWDWYIE